MAPIEPTILRADAGRFSRLEAIGWWNQTLLHETRILVVGAGALGNEAIKNLALLGVGHLAIADMDRVELSNLSRSVLFRESDEGQAKAECAARAARQIYGAIRATPLQGNILAELGLGWFRWADAVIGALDNREARVFVNSACARVGRPWIDGGIEVLHGIVRGFAPPKTACYECTMSQVDWQVLNQRRSCSLLARRALDHGGTPTTPITASVIGAIQVQEVVKFLHQKAGLFGRGFVFDGDSHSSYAVNYPINPDCPWHEPPAPIQSQPHFNSRTKMTDLWRAAALQLGEVDALDFAREIVARLECPGCGRNTAVYRPAESIREDALHCPACRQECVPAFLHSLSETSDELNLTAEQIGLPAWDIVWARRGAASIGFEFTGDNPFNGADGARSEKT